jgi:hypothetical protein
VNVWYREEGPTNTSAERATALERWLEVKPYKPQSLARQCEVPLHTMLRAIRGLSPLPPRAALVLAGLLGAPFEELFEYRTYRNGRRVLEGWFARRASEHEGAA